MQLFVPKLKRWDRGSSKGSHGCAFLGGLSFSSAFIHILAYCSRIPSFVALWRAMELCTELDLDNVQLKGDAQTLIKAIKNEDECWACGMEILLRMLNQFYNIECFGPLALFIGRETKQPTCQQRMVYVYMSNRFGQKNLLM